MLLVHSRQRPADNLVAHSWNTELEISLIFVIFIQSICSYKLVREASLVYCKWYVILQSELWCLFAVVFRMARVWICEILFLAI